MAEVSLLAYVANPITKPALVVIGESFERLIEHAHQSIREDRISVFDQAQINSFIAGRSGEARSYAHGEAWEELIPRVQGPLEAPSLLCVSNKLANAEYFLATQAYQRPAISP
jgi:hypothetical protein